MHAKPLIAGACMHCRTRCDVLEAASAHTAAYAGASKQPRPCEHSVRAIARACFERERER
eukprot:1028176-Pleurochrysis_carterae.AAC.1